MKRILVYGPPLQTALETFIATKQAEIGHKTRWGGDFFTRLQPFATAGKLLRGSIVCFSYEMYSGEAPDDSVIKAAMALELTQSALLVHDDIMDGDELRRGQPALHMQYQTAGVTEGLLDTPQFGINMGICGGDTALFLAFELLASAGATPKTRATAQQLFAKQLVDTCIGQMQDVYYEARPDMPPKQAIYGIMQAKTATYTVALPLTMGAALAGRSAATLQKLQNIGTAIGTIFQIRDDELGALGNSAKTGKPVGADIREGKKTLLYYYLAKKCTVTERRKIKTIFGNSESTHQDITYIQRLIRQHRIPQLLNKDIDRLQTKVMTAIDKLDITTQSKADLLALVAFCANRQF